MAILLINFVCIVVFGLIIFIWMDRKRLAGDIKTKQIYFHLFEEIDTAKYSSTVYYLPITMIRRLSFVAIPTFLSGMACF